MPQIHILDEPTINQIAAGEVVERPSAVVKELIENAMDAGATAITAEIKEGGLSFIRITDNGSGIAKEDITLAFLRHATSKIRVAEDLLTVTSLGFRGEALSSIAAVSQLELITKTSSALNGFRYLMEGGTEKSMEEIGCPCGTTIIVRNIFYNTPARRKFLKSAITEAGYISELMERLMVSHPGVSFKFIMNNQVKLQSSGNHSSKDILYHVYGRDIAKELSIVEFDSEDVKITGYIGKPMITRGNRNNENYFINGRYIKSNIITKAIEEAYKPYMMQHKYPFTSLYFEINPTLIDVNVHPQKMEIRLKNGEEVYKFTYQAVKSALSNREIIPQVILTPQKEEKKETVSVPEPFEQNRRQQLENFAHRKENNYNIQQSNNDTVPIQNRIQYDRTENQKTASTLAETTDYNIDKKQIKIQQEQDMQPLAKDSINQPQNTTISEQDTMKQTKYAMQQIQESLIPVQNIMHQTKNATSEQLNLFEQSQAIPEAPFLSKQALQEHRIIGQVFSTYWLVEYKNELYIIDQHAAHEKVLYEKIVAAAKEKTHSSQQLYPPLVLTLSIREQEIIHRYDEVLSSLGYEFEHFGGNEFSVRAVPSNLYGISEKELLLEFIDELAEEVTGNTTGTMSILEKIASMSCKAAVKANHSMSKEEAQELIKELLKLDNPYHCPHGRPVIVSMSQYELERKFKRII